MVMINGNRSVHISLFLSLFLFFSPSIFGEDNAQRELQLDSVTVTAQKREENVQKVPVSINTFNNLEVSDAGVNSISDIARFIPNVFFKEATMENVIVVRGVSSVDTSIVGPVGVYVDDVSYPLLFMHNIDLVDIERVEMLRGPQGTLYGRNTESGVLNIVTSKPGEEFKAQVKADYGFYDTAHGSIPTWKTSFSASGPAINDKLYFGISGQKESSDGYMKNTRLDTEDSAKNDHQTLRGNLRWEVNDRLEMSFIADHSEFDDKQDLYRIFVSDGGLKNSDREETRGFYDSQMDQEGAGGVVKVKYEADGFDLLSITGRREYIQDAVLGTGVGLYDYGKNVWKFEDAMFSQEIRMTSKDDTDRLQWLVGLYTFSEGTDIYFSKYSDMQVRETDVEKRGSALFSQLTFTFLENLHLTLGGRSEHLQMSGSQKLKGSTSGAYNKDLEYNEFLPKTVLSYDVKEGVMMFLSAAKGYLEGGYNYANSTDVDSFTYDPEYTWNYELGTKTNWLSNKLQLNAYLYYIKMVDKQVSEYTAGGGIAQISNAATRAHSQGLELEMKARVMQGLDITASYGYIKAEIDEWETGSSDYSGNKIPNTPEYTYNIGVQYRHGNGFFGHADLMGTGEMYGDVQNHSWVKLEPYELLNLRAGYETEKYDVTLWCKNVFNKEYYTSAFDYGAKSENIGVAQNGEPSSYGVSVAYRF